jgi:hypothetical protein
MYIAQKFLVILKYILVFTSILKNIDFTHIYYRASIFYLFLTISILYLFILPYLPILYFNRVIFSINYYL